MINIEIIGAWISVLFTLSILSYLYKDNPFYKSAEHIFVGASAGYWAVTYFWTQVHPNLFGRLWPASQFDKSESFLHTLWYLPYHAIRQITTVFGIANNDVFPIPKQLKMFPLCYVQSVIKTVRYFSDAQRNSSIFCNGSITSSL